MIHNILTKGWILRIFIVLLWLLALLARCFTEQEKIAVVAMIIGFANSFLYLTVAARLILLTHNPTLSILPNYFSQLKKSLLVILLLSLIPTFILLPHFTVWLALLTMLIFMAVLFVTITYQQKLYIGFLLLLFLPYSAESFLSQFTGINLSLLLALSLPVVAWWAYRLLNRLEIYKGDEKHIKRITALAGLNVSNTVAFSKQVPLNSQNKFMQWLTNSNFAHYRKIICSVKSMSNVQLLTVACQNSGSIGGTTYLFWGVAVLVFSLLGVYFGAEYQNVFMPMLIIFPAAIIGTGTLSQFQVINNQKSLLKRLSIMPCFSDKNSFSLALLTYVIADQLKLYIFISLVVAVLAYVFHHLTVNMYLNVLFAGLTLCVFNLTLMFWVWSSKVRFEHLVIWLMTITFIIFMVLLIGADNHKIILWKNVTFIAFALICFSLFCASFYRSYRYGLKEW